MGRRRNGVVNRTVEPSFRTFLLQDEKDCVTTGELVDLFCNTWGEGSCWENRFDGGPHEANFLKLDCSKLKNVFGWKPKLGVSEAIQMTVEWTKCWMSGGDIEALSLIHISEPTRHA